MCVSSAIFLIFVEKDTLMNIRGKISGQERMFMHLLPHEHMSNQCLNSRGVSTQNRRCKYIDAVNILLVAQSVLSPCVWVYVAGCDLGECICSHASPSLKVGLFTAMDFKKREEENREVFSYKKAVCNSVKCFIRFWFYSYKNIDIVNILLVPILLCRHVGQFMPYCSKGVWH